MDTRRIRDGERISGRSADGGAESGGNARDGIFSVIVIVLLFALAFWAAAVLPQALQIATVTANASAAIPAYSERGDAYPRDIEEEQPEPPLAGRPVTRPASRAARQLLASLSDQSYSRKRIFAFRAPIACRCAGASASRSA